jgi:hypothetical protein
MSKPKFTPESFGYPNHSDGLLEAAARLTLRLAMRCDWVEGCEDTDDPDDPDSWDSLYMRIGGLTAAYTHKSGADDVGNSLAYFAGSVAHVIASVPSLRAAIAAHLASTQDSDP